MMDREVIFYQSNNLDYNVGVYQKAAEVSWGHRWCPIQGWSRHLDLMLSRQASYLCTHLSDFLNLNVFIYKMEIILSTF